jgi:hypothetical protein
VIAIGLIAATIGCGKKDLFRDIRSGDYSLVEKGSYRGTTEYIGSGDSLARTIARYRGGIEKDPDLLPKITRYCYRVPDILVFRYKMALLDRSAHALVLRYFAPIYDDHLIAGYQVFLVFDLDRDELIRACVSEVPLE